MGYNNLTNDGEDMSGLLKLVEILPQTKIESLECAAAPKCLLLCQRPLTHLRTLFPSTHSHPRQKASMFLPLSLPEHFLPLHVPSRVRKRARSFLGPFPEHFLPWSFQKPSPARKHTYTRVATRPVHTQSMPPSIVRRVDRGHILLQTGGLRGPTRCSRVAHTPTPVWPPRRSLRSNWLNNKAEQAVKDAAGSGVDITF